MPPVAVLADVVVVEVGQAIAGSVAGKVLAESGARVVKAPLVALGRERAQVIAGFASWDRSKRVLAADGSADDELLALLDSADVVIDQRWCGGRDRVAVALEHVAVRDDVVLCRVDTGLSLPAARLAVLDLESLIGAASGVFATAISGQSLAGMAFVDVPVASVAAGLHIATAIAVALSAGAPRVLDVAITDVPSALKGVEFSRSEHLATVQATQIAASGVYRCADGEWIQLDAPSLRMTARLHGALDAAGCDLDGLDALLVPLVAVTPPQAKAIRAALTAVFATRPADAWERFLASSDVPCGRCRTPTEWFESELARACGAVRHRGDHGDSIRLEAGEVWR